MFKDKTVGVLENKENNWHSTDLWKIVSKGGDLVRIEKVSEEKPDFDSSTESYTNNPNDQEGGKFIEIVYKVIGFLKNPFGGGDKVYEEKDGEKEGLLWKKGQLNTDEYFTLETPKGAKVLTANSKGGLEIKGNFG